jgi:hypothetical protein
MDKGTQAKVQGKTDEQKVAERLPKDIDRSFEKSDSKQKSYFTEQFSENTKLQVDSFKKMMKPGSLIKSAGLFTGSPLLMMMGDKVGELLDFNKEAKAQYKEDQKAETDKLKEVLVDANIDSKAIAKILEETEDLNGNDNKDIAKILADNGVKNKDSFDDFISTKKAFDEQYLNSNFDIITKLQEQKKSDEDILKFLRSGNAELLETVEKTAKEEPEESDPVVVEESESLIGILNNTEQLISYSDAIIDAILESNKITLNPEMSADASLPGILENTQQLVDYSDSMIDAILGNTPKEDFNKEQYDDSTLEALEGIWEELKNLDFTGKDSTEKDTSKDGWLDEIISGGVAGLVAKNGLKAFLATALSGLMVGAVGLAISGLAAYAFPKIQDFFKELETQQSAEGMIQSIDVINDTEDRQGWINPEDEARRAAMTKALKEQGIELEQIYKKYGSVQAFFLQREGDWVTAIKRTEAEKALALEETAKDIIFNKGQEAMQAKAVSVHGINAKVANFPVTETPTSVNAFNNSSTVNNFPTDMSPVSDDASLNKVIYGDR